MVTGHRGGLLLTSYYLLGLVVKGPTSTAEDRKFNSRLHLGDFSKTSHNGDLKLALQWLPCHAAGIKGSALGLVGPESV